MLLFKAKVPKCIVSESSAAPRTVRVLPRGNWMDESGEVVTPALPAVFAREPAADRRLTRLDLAGVQLLVIENVGNLVCPANYDLGEAKKVVVVSTTEGADKPLKYPTMFRNASIQSTE